MTIVFQEPDQKSALEAIRTRLETMSMPQGYNLRRLEERLRHTERKLLEDAADAVAYKEAKARQPWPKSKLAWFHPRSYSIPEIDYSSIPPLTIDEIRDFLRQNLLPRVEEAFKSGKVIQDNQGRTVLSFAEPERDERFQISKCLDEFQRLGVLGACEFDSTVSKL